MNITQADLDKINPNGPKIKHKGDFISLKLSDMYGESILFTHGHNYTMFNAPYITNPPTKISPLPIGYYASRAYAFYVKNTVRDKTVSDFPNQKIPDPNKASFISLAWQAIQPGETLLDVFVSFLNQTTGFSPKAQISLPNNVKSTLEEAKYIYKDLYKKWVNDNGG
ncbi:hypothetical protein [Romboutsia sp.]|uniref:hypothetical protein n=1 Tax=Romboutsia sp. TaxID=1965302 RepID=UPI003F390600